MLAILLAGQLLLVGNSDRVYTPDSQDRAVIKENSPGTYTLQTPGGKNLGYGRESEYGTGNILFYKPNGDRWFTVKPNQAPSGRERGDSGGGGRRGR